MILSEIIIKVGVGEWERRNFPLIPKAKVNKDEISKIGII